MKTWRAPTSFQHNIPCSISPTQQRHCTGLPRWSGTKSFGRSRGCQEEGAEIAPHDLIMYIDHISQEGGEILRTWTPLIARINSSRGQASAVGGRQGTKHAAWVWGNLTDISSLK